MIPVTKPFLPPKEEYQKLVDGIWDRQWLIGAHRFKLESKLKEYLNLSLMLCARNVGLAMLNRY
jgi:hypothetical protein